MIIFFSDGRLGNQIFQYAFLNTIAKRKEKAITIVVFIFSFSFKLNIKEINIKFKKRREKTPPQNLQK